MLIINKQNKSKQKHGKQKCLLVHITRQLKFDLRFETWNTKPRHRNTVTTKGIGRTRNQTSIIESGTVQWRISDTFRCFQYFLTIQLIFKNFNIECCYFWRKWITSKCCNSINLSPSYVEIIGWKRNEIRNTLVTNAINKSPK